MPLYLIEPFWIQWKALLAMTQPQRCLTRSRSTEMRSARASASHQRPNGTGRSTRLKSISYDAGRKLAAAAWSLTRV